MSPTSKGLFLTLAASGAAAFYLTIYKLALPLGDPSDAVFYLLVSAAVLNSVTSVVQGGLRGLWRFNRLSLFVSLGLAVFTLLGNHFAAEAVARISAPLTSVVQQTQVLFVALLGGLLLGEGVNRRFWIGTAVAGLGLSVLHLAPDETIRLEAVGTAMAAGSAFCFAAMALLTRRYIHQIVPIPVNALRLWMSVALWLAVERRVPSVTAENQAFVAYCAVAAAFGPFLSRTALMYALQHVPASTTVLVGLVTPIITLLVAFAAFGTLPEARELVGGTIMLAGIAIPLLTLRSGAAQRVPAE